MRLIEDPSDQDLVALECDCGEILRGEPQCACGAVLDERSERWLAKQWQALLAAGRQQGDCGAIRFRRHRPGERAAAAAYGIIY